MSIVGGEIQVTFSKAQQEHSRLNWAVWKIITTSCMSNRTAGRSSGSSGKGMGQSDENTGTQFRPASRASAADTSIIALQAAQDDGAEVELINTINLNIGRCIGCGACSRNSREKGQQIRCVIQDDYPMVLEAILDADSIIVAAPVYFLRPTGQLKNLTTASVRPTTGRLSSKNFTKESIRSPIRPIPFS